MGNKISIINGSNLNLLGIREVSIYGKVNFLQLKKNCKKKAQSLGYNLEFKQSNYEGKIVDWIQNIVKKQQNYLGLIINAAAYTHTSIAILDALKMLSIPVVEVHISNIHEREDFRKHSYISLVAKKLIHGEGIKGYEMAIDYLDELKNHSVK